MFTFGVKFVLACYAGVRVYEKFRGPEPAEIETRHTKTTDDNNEREKNLHYMKMTGLTVGLAGLANLNPVFLPVMLGSFTYVAIPYLRVFENSILVKKKIDGYVLYGIADFMALGLGRLVAASLAVGLLHTARFVISNAKRNSKQTLLDVFGEQPNKVWVIIEDQEVEVPLVEVQPGDIIAVNTGDMIPVDGLVVEGIAAIDQHRLTGESQPAEKTEGDQVFASTQIMRGRLCIRVTTSGSDTTVAKISEVLSHSVDFKSSSQLRGEQWADSWNIPILALGFASMPLLGPAGTVAILNAHMAQAIRVVAPLATLNHISIASQKGILIKDGRVLEDLPGIDTFLFDKTGTLTSDEPVVGRVLIYHSDYSEEDILAYAAAAEGKLKHPIARAIVKRASQANIDIPRVDDADYKIGHGVSVNIDGKLIQLGSQRFMSGENITLPDDLSRQLQDTHGAGHSLVMLAIDGQLAGVLEMHATVRPEVSDLLAGLRQRGVKHLAIVSGDHRQPTQALTARLGMDDCFYEVMPQHKADIVEQLQAEGRSVCFVGDGVNDTIAMKKANVSISLSGATSIATDTAQIVLMDGSLGKLVELFDIAVALNKNLEMAWRLNMVPSMATIFSTFAFRIDIIVALFISQSGLATGIVNATLPLRKARKEAERLTQAAAFNDRELLLQEEADDQSRAGSINGSPAPGPSP